MRLVFLLICLLASGGLSAQDGGSAFERSLERDNSVRSEESSVEIKGMSYWKVQFNGEHYYVHFRPGNEKTADVYCVPPPGAQDEHLSSDVQSFRRSGAFVQAFHESCSKEHGKKKADLKLNPKAGLEKH